MPSIGLWHDGAVSPLATAVYEVLRRRVPAAKPEISYEELCAKLPPALGNIEPNDQRLWIALGDIVRACRAADLPAISAIVVNKHTRIPGKLYYSVAHPNEDEPHAMVAWGHEVLKVRVTTYPTTL